MTNEKEKEDEWSMLARQREELQRAREQQRSAADREWRQMEQQRLAMDREWQQLERQWLAVDEERRRCEETRRRLRAWQSDLEEAQQRARRRDKKNPQQTLTGQMGEGSRRRIELRCPPPLFEQEAQRRAVDWTAADAAAGTSGSGEQRSAPDDGRLVRGVALWGRAVICRTHASSPTDGAAHGGTQTGPWVVPWGQENQRVDWGGVERDFSGPKMAHVSDGAGIG